MKHSEQHRRWAFHSRFRPAAAALATGIVFALVAVLAQSVQAQTFTVLHNFTNGADGGEPWAGLSMDRAGNFYGTASTGGNTSACTYPNPPGCGTVFKLSRKGSGWVFTTLYTFSGPDGARPMARVIIRPDGSLYGTTSSGGTGPCSYGSAPACGTVFNLRPPAAACKSALCPWTETVLYSFQGFTDGVEPTFGDLVFDGAGNIYGTTSLAVKAPMARSIKLTPSNGGWTETVFYRFQGGLDGATHYAGVVFDRAGLVGNDCARRDL